MGFTLDPLYKNMLNVKIVISPFDKIGNKVAWFYHDYFKNIP